MLQIRDLTFSHGAQPLFAGFSLRVADYVTVVKGPTGCGKSTLLRLLAGVLRPASAQGMPDSRQTLLVLQEDALLPWLTGWGNISLVCGVSREELETHPLFPRVKSFIGQRAYQMSYGQRRLIELLRAFLVPRSYVMLDEPFNFLDSNSQNDLVTYINSGAIRSEVILIATHELASLKALKAKTLRFPPNRPVSKLEESE